MYVILIYGLASRFFCTSSYEPLNKDSSQVPQIFPAPYSPWVVSHVQLPAWPSNGRTTSSCSCGPANSFISLLLLHTLINYITMTITIYHYIKLCRYIYILHHRDLFRMIQDHDPRMVWIYGRHSITHYGWGLQTDELRWFMDVW